MSDKAQKQALVKETDEMLGAAYTYCLFIGKDLSGSESLHALA